jgi:tRNA (cmo5U34)-methyltransferase
MSKDEIYKAHSAEAGSFTFDDNVARVFPDMLERSIPGYAMTLDGIGALAARYVATGTRCYDLGCSLGAASLAMRRHIRETGCEIHAVDQAEAMVRRCREIVARDESPTPVFVAAKDVRDVEIRNASMVVMNYTLQFLPTADRAALIRRIYDGMNAGGVFVLSEKVANDDPVVEALLVDLHHDFKRANDYSALEIARKRSALENVLIPETTAAHLDRLRNAGFAHAGVWLRHYNFLSIVAIR